MSSESNSNSMPHPQDEPLTPMQEAIRARAIATLENDERQPKPSRRRKIITGALAVVTVLILGFGIDFGVRIFQRVLALYVQDDAGAPAPAATGADQPYFITVDPPADAPATATSSSSSAGMTAE